MNAIQSFQQEIESLSQRKIELKINDNRSTMLSVRWEPKRTKVSIHRIFLGAPRNVMDSLACYICRKEKIISPNVKAFIEDNLKKLDYSHKLNPSKLYIQGNVYNLKEVYDELNDEYFHGMLDLAVTWFNSAKRRNRSRITFGLYHDPLKLIKINRLLDSPSVPDYVVKFVMYHEMLHHICRPYVDEKGLNRVHSKEFKKLESEFGHFELAQNWIQKHRTHLFEV